MRERPILFSGPMVRAILDGRKTQTRRVVKGSPVDVVRFIGADDRPTNDFGLCLTHEHVIDQHVRCPYGVPGDRLWVRETWSFIGRQGIWELSQAARWNCTPIYRADDAVADRWWPSIHMPRWASRITLEITDVRVERLNEITDADSEAEGIERGLGLDGRWRDYGVEHLNIRWQPTPRDSFRTLWEHINGAGSWTSNPWVWVIEFRRAA